MRRAKSILGRVTAAIGLGVAASSAHAVPIVFDFTGTVSRTTHYLNGQMTEDPTLTGQTVVGRITVETDGLVPATVTAPGQQTLAFYQDLLGGPALITSELSIGGTAYDMNIYSDTYGTLTAVDSTGPVCPGCGYAPDNIWLDGGSSTYLSATPGGEFFSRTLNLSWSDPSNPLGLIDLSVGFDPSNLMSVLAGLLPEYGYYRDITWFCPVDDSGCWDTASTDTRFTVDTLTLHTPSVPEPGTLALFAVGLLGGAVARRSAVKAR